MDCGHGWRNDTDCDTCRPPAIVVAGLRGRVSELETTLREVEEDMREQAIGSQDGYLLAIADKLREALE